MKGKMGYDLKKDWYGSQGISPKLLVFYLGGLKGTGAPIVIGNPGKGHKRINTARLELKNVSGRVVFNNAPPGIVAEGPTTVLEIDIDGEPGDEYPD